MQVNDVQLVNPDIRGSLSLLCVLNEDLSSPYIDMQVEYDNGNAISAYKYLPVTIMDKQLVAWLDNAFKSGKVTHGGFTFNGRLGNFPFAHYDGHMLADFFTEDVQLDYLPGWPKIQTKDGHLMITGLGLLGTTKQGVVYDSQYRDAEFRIDEFHLPRLDVNGSFQGETRDMIQFLVQSPIAKEARGIYEQSKITGQLAGRLDLHVPLSKAARDIAPMDYLVETSIKDSRLDLWDNKLVIDNINGEVSYRPRKLKSRNLQAKFLQQDVALRLFSRAGDKSDELLLNMKGKLNAQYLHEHLPFEMLKQVEGITDWDGVLSLGKWYLDGRHAPGYLHFKSNLTGISSRLPAPLNKDTESSKELQVQLRLPENGVLPVYARLGKEWAFALALDLDDKSSGILKKGAVNFMDETAQLPKENELLIRGLITELPLTQWAQQFRQENLQASKPFIGPDLPVRLDLDYVHFVTEDSEAEAGTADPRKLPLVNGVVRKLVFNKMEYGKVELASKRHEDGIIFDQLKIAGQHLNATGELSWKYRDGKSLTNLLAQVQSDNLGNLLTEWGYSAVLRNGNLQAVVQADWSGSPNQFDFARLNASVGAVVSDGVISEVKPGAGRLLGLLSLSELPRRLQLDFNEFRSGLAFSQIVGQIEVTNGLSHIDTLRIISPVALMQIEGETDLVNKTFNQTLKIAPNISGTAPVVSWLALGGQVGALVFVLDQLFGNAFNESVGTDYRVTGTWENPVVEKISPVNTQTVPDNIGD
jgi:uncharacterized protein YhdP